MFDFFRIEVEKGTNRRMKYRRWEKQSLFSCSTTLWISINNQSSNLSLWFCSLWRVNCYTLPALTSMITVGSLTEGVRSFLEDFLTILLLLNPPRLLNSNSKLLRKLVFFFSFFDNWGIQLSGSFNSASLFFQLLSQFYRIIEKVMY